jgi:hypothetical protein
MIKAAAIFLLVVSLILIALGGLLDFTNSESFMGLSKYHYWADGVFVAVLSTWLVLWQHTNSEKSVNA